MKNSTILDGKTVGPDEPCFIISEIGSNHCGSLEQAFKMIEISKECGADAVKFQSYKAETLYSKYVPRRVMPDGTEGPDIYKMISDIQMPYSWHSMLKDHCDKVGVSFFSSPFDNESIESLEKVECPFYKIASSEIGDPLLLKSVAKTGKPMILSTGKATFEDIDRAVKWCNEEGNNQLILLHCTATYPAKYDSMNLNCISSMKERYDHVIGLSDHNTENITAIAAIALGAKVIEKHFTLDKKAKGPDHHFALDPDGLKQLCSWVKKTEISLGDGVKKITECEKEGFRIANRSIHVNKNLNVGDVIQASDIIIKRPSLGISPKNLNDIIGKKVKKEIKEDMWLTWDHL